MLPQVLCPLFWAVLAIKRGECGGDELKAVFVSLLYPLTVPAISIYYSGKLLHRGENEEDREMLNKMTGLKIFENLGL